MMKLLLLDNTSLVSRENRLYCVEGTGQFASELVKLGIDVTMYGQKSVSVSSSAPTFDIELHGIKAAGLWRKNNKILNYIALYLNAIKYIYKADFVYFFYPSAFRYLAFICQLLGKRFGLYVRGNEGLEDKISKKIYGKAIIVLTVSQLFTDMVNSVTKSHKAENIRPMLNYDNRDVVYNRDYKNKDCYELLFLCRIEKAKGLSLLINALSRIKALNQYLFHLTVVGDGDYLEKAKEESRLLDLVGEISFLGGIYDDTIKADIYKKADLYILPTYYNEGFPRTLYEAMIFGTPILTTEVAGISSLMKDGVNCLRLKPQSVESIVDALVFSFNNYDKMGKLAINGANMVAKIVDRNRPTHAHQLYNKIIEYGK